MFTVTVRLFETVVLPVAMFTIELFDTHEYTAHIIFGVLAAANVSDIVTAPDAGLKRYQRL